MSPPEFTQIEWDAVLEDDCRQLIRLAVREDLGRAFDLTTVALVPAEARGQAAVVARRAGVIAGLNAAELALVEMNAQIAWTTQVADGAKINAGQTVAVMAGSARDLLTCERPVLNLLGRLSGIASLTRQYVDRVAGGKARIYETRKTTPGLRRLEKYAVRCGGGTNHRTGLFDAVLIKDNHLAWGAAASAAGDSQRYTPAQAVLRAKQFIAEHLPLEQQPRVLIEVEVDSLEQLDQVLPTEPHIVLLDNMQPQILREAVRRRNAAWPRVQLEASGGITLETVAEVAQTGVERISIGALTHSAIVLDLGLDWKEGGEA